jgi:hypothetical protein
MPGQIVTLGEKRPEPIAGKPLNEVIEIQEGMSYIIKIAGGNTLVVNPNTIIGTAPKVGQLVMDYCEECKSYKYSDMFRTRCHYRSEYICTPSTMVYFKKQSIEQKEVVQVRQKEIVQEVTDKKNNLSKFSKLKKLLHMR